MLVGEPVEHPAPITGCLDDAVGSEEPQRVRDRGFADPRLAGEIRDADLTLLFHEHEQPQASGIRQHREQVGHDPDVLFAARGPGVTMTGGSDSWHFTEYICTDVQMYSIGHTEMPAPKPLAPRKHRGPSEASQLR